MMFKCNCDTFQANGIHAAECGANPEQLHNRFLAFAEGLEQSDLVAMLREWIYFAELPEHCMTQSLKRVELATATPVTDNTLWRDFKI